MESYPIFMAWIQEMRQMKMSVSVDVESIVQSFMPYIICKLQKRHMRSRVRTWENCYKCDCFVIG